MIQGPLLQRASITTSTSHLSDVTLQAQLPTEWSIDYVTSFTGDRTDSQISLSPAFTNVIRGYSNRVPVSRGIVGCHGICTTEIAGAGFAVTCASTTTKIDNSDLVEKVTGTYPSTTATATVFATAISDVDDQLSTLSANLSASASFQIDITFLSAKWTAAETCPRSMTSRKCIISPGTVMYPVSLANNTVSLLPPAAGGYHRTVVPFQGANVESNLDPLGGFQTYLGQLYGSDDSLVTLEAEVKYDET